jgi:hypothetical protein
MSTPKSGPPAPRLVRLVWRLHAEPMQDLSYADSRILPDWRGRGEVEW